MTGTVKAWIWQCQDCMRECVPIRAESRCMCGHRLKEHIDGHRCSDKSCNCPKFSFIVAEGSWILRCRCKHKHTEHCPVSHACKKPKCDCSAFFSPWVCNCDHPWASHKQILVEKQVFRLSDMLAREQTSDEANSIPGAADQQDQQSRGAASAANQVEMTAAATQQLQQLDISNSQRTSSAGALSLPPSTSHGSANSSRTLPHHPKVQASMSSRQHQQQQQESDAISSDVSVMTPGYQGDTASDHAVIMEGDLNCEVNRYDLLQRGR